MPIARRQLLARAAASAALPAFFIGRAQAAEFTLKCAITSAPTHPLSVRLTEASKRIAEQSHGQIDFQVYPSSQLGGDVDVLAQTKIGAVQFQCIGGTTTSSMVPGAAINGIGFAFKDYATVWAAMDGEVGQLVREDYAKAGFYCYQKSFDNGFRQLTTTSRLVNTVADVRGLKLRVPPAAIWVSLWRALGASPTTIDLSEVYSALQTKIVEGEENALALIESNKLYEVQKHCALTNHQWDGWWLLGNKPTWDKLPDSAKDILSRNFEIAVVAERADIADNTAALQKTLEGQGLAFNIPDRQSFKQALDKTNYYKDWAAKFGPKMWGALEKYSGPLG